MELPAPPLSHVEVELLSRIKKLAEDQTPSAPPPSGHTNENPPKTQSECSAVMMVNDADLGLTKKQRATALSLVELHNYNESVSKLGTEIEMKLNEIKQMKDEGVRELRVDSSAEQTVVHNVHIATQYIEKLKEHQKWYNEILAYDELMRDPQVLFRSPYKYNNILSAIDNTLLSVSMDIQRNPEVIQDLEEAREAVGRLLRQMLSVQLTSLSTNALRKFKKMEQPKIDILTFYAKFKSLGVVLRPFMKYIGERASTQTYGLSNERAAYASILSSLSQCYMSNRLELLNQSIPTVLEHTMKNHMDRDATYGALLGTKSIFSYSRNLIILENETISAFFGVGSKIIYPSLNVLVSFLGQQLSSFLKQPIMAITNLDHLSELSDFMELEIKDISEAEGEGWIQEVQQFHYFVQERLVFLLEVHLNTSFKSSSQSANIESPIKTKLKRCSESANSPVVPDDKNNEVTPCKLRSKHSDPLLRSAFEYLAIAYSGLTLTLFEKVAACCLRKVLEELKLRVDYLIHSTVDNSDNAISADIMDVILPEAADFHASLYGLSATSTLIDQLTEFDLKLINDNRIVDFSEFRQRLWKLISMHGVDGDVRLREPVSVLDFFTPSIITIRVDIMKQLETLNDHWNANSVACALTLVGKPLFRIDNKVASAIKGEIPPPTDDEDNVRPDHRRQTLLFSDITDAITESLAIFQKNITKIPVVAALYISEKGPDKFNLPTITDHMIANLRLREGESGTEEVIISRISKEPVDAVGLKENYCLKRVDEYKKKYLSVEDDKLTLKSWWNNFCLGLVELYARFELCMRCELEMGTEELLRTGWISMARFENLVSEISLRLGENR